MTDINDLYIQCVMGKDKEILSQNSYCIDKCGDMVGNKCNKGCQKHLSDSFDTDMVFLKNRLVHDNYYNITCFIKDALKIINLYPTKNITQVIPTEDLTKKEKEVADLIFAGYKNTEILEILSISKSTLKTHINRIYQKIGDEFKKLRPSTI